MQKTMKALVKARRGYGNMEIREVPIPDPGDYDVLMRVWGSGICGTDVHITGNPPGYIATEGTVLGHEFCGIIKAKGENVDQLEVGDRVVVNPNDYCGKSVPAY